MFRVALLYTIVPMSVNEFVAMIKFRFQVCI